MKRLILFISIILLVSALTLMLNRVNAQSKTNAGKYVKPIYNEWTVYGEGDGLLGIMRGWNPCTFYKLDTSFHKHLIKWDRDMLADSARLHAYLLDKQYVNIRYSDTSFLPFDDYAPIRLKPRKPYY